jgi:hypothetical protein
LSKRVPKSFLCYNWLSFTSECMLEPIEQNAMYSGYHSDTMVNNIFAYGPDGKVFLLLSTFQVAGMIHL